MKKTILTLAVMLAGMLSTQAQTIPTLVLDDTNPDIVSFINENAEKGGNYYVTFTDRRINMDFWNVLCLPFDVKVYMVSDAFYYAAVDMLIKNSKDGNIHFEPVSDGPVNGYIPAGTPFIVKVSKDCPTNNFNGITFKGVKDRKTKKYKGVTLKKVDNPSGEPYVQTDDCGNRFVGTLQGVTVLPAGSKDYWYMSKCAWYDTSERTKDVNLKPFRAYIDFSQNTVTEAPMIIIEEPDGTTTVIDPATFNKGEFKTDGTQDDGWYSVTGMRLTQEPTAKGVYIHNARKVVIK